MLKPTKISCAVALAVSVAAPPTMAQTSNALEEIVVTATKREASAQDIPVTIQAIGEKALDDLGVQNFDDYIKNLAGVTSGGRGPGHG